MWGPLFLGTSCLPSKNFKANLKHLLKHISTTSKIFLIKSKYPQTTNAISIAHKNRELNSKINGQTRSDPRRGRSFVYDISLYIMGFSDLELSQKLRYNFVLPTRHPLFAVSCVFPVKSFIAFLNYFEL
jgi:hypothetical protein